jgi:N-methyl-L-tryptophan oxidase
MAFKSIRTTYIDPTYTKLAKRANFHDWPALEKNVGCKLLHPNSRCLFGSGTALEKYIEMATNTYSNLEVELLDASEARQRFPQFNFFDSPNVLHDHSSKVIAAKDTMDHLARVITERNISVFNNTKVFEIKADEVIKVFTTRGLMCSERLIVTAGPWVKCLFPELDTHVFPIKQTVGYYRLQGEAKRYQIGSTLVRAKIMTFMDYPSLNAKE